MSDGGVEIRLLGDPRLIRDGEELALPASKKTRALLFYLASTGSRHRRDALCDLLWDGPNDPRAELRWSLSKIRSAFGDDTRFPISADRERIGLDVTRIKVD